MPVKLKKKSFFFGRVNLTAKTIFVEELSLMLKSGLTIIDALSIAGSAANGTLRKIIIDLLSTVNAGNTLAEAMSKHPKVFSALFIKTVEAGEKSGALEDNLTYLSVQLTKEKVLKDKIKGAMIYPVVVLSAAFALGMGMAFFILPKITPMFIGLKITLPFTTRMLLKFSDLVQTHGVVLFGGIIAAVAFVLWLSRQKFVYPITHFLLLRAPIISKISFNANIAGFCRTLSTLLKSGLNIDEAILITKETMSNYYYYQALKDISKHVGKGAQLSELLSAHKHLFPDMVIKMIAVGEESGRLSETLSYLSNFYENEVDNATKNLAVAIEPILLLFIGLVVGFLALSIITPIYNITGNIGR